MHAAAAALLVLGAAEPLLSLAAADALLAAAERILALAAADLVQAAAGVDALLAAVDALLAAVDALLAAAAVGPLLAELRRAAVDFGNSSLQLPTLRGFETVQRESSAAECCWHEEGPLC